MCGRNQMMAG